MAGLAGSGLPAGTHRPKDIVCPHSNLLIFLPPAQAAGLHQDWGVAPQGVSSGHYEYVEPYDPLQSPPPTRPPRPPRPYTPFDAMVPPAPSILPTGPAGCGLPKRTLAP